MTGLDRVAEDGAQQPIYNGLLVWPCGAPEMQQLEADHPREEDGTHEAPTLCSSVSREARADGR